jgi:hypothetical protein
MAEPPPGPHPGNPNPWKSIFQKLLFLGVLLVAVVVIFTLIYQQGLVPAFLLPVTPGGIPPAETAVPETTSSGYISLVETLTAAPLVKTPTPEAPLNTPPSAGTPPEDLPAPTEPLAETPVPPTSLVPSLTPAFGTCQYTLKAGQDDFLYAIYWNWHIDNNIPYLQDYYAKISCGALLSNLECNYQPATPNVTQPGWILVLPGVPAELCLSHAGIPAP